MSAQQVISEKISVAKDARTSVDPPDIRTGISMICDPVVSKVFNTAYYLSQTQNDEALRVSRLFPPQHHHGTYIEQESL